MYAAALYLQTSQAEVGVDSSCTIFVPPGMLGGCHTAGKHVQLALTRLVLERSVNSTHRSVATHTPTSCYEQI